MVFNDHGHERTGTFVRRLRARMDRQAGARDQNHAHLKSGAARAGDHQADLKRLEHQISFKGSYGLLMRLRPDPFDLRASLKKLWRWGVQHVRFTWRALGELKTTQECFGEA